MAPGSSSALIDLVQRSRAAIRDAVSDETEQLLFVDNRLTPTPQFILVDPVLTPYDKVVWQGILVIAQTSQTSLAGAGTAMPSYDDLGKYLNISRETISISIAALRATRWLICNKVRDDQGQVRGSLYVVAYTPWDLKWALEIDERYLDWTIHQSCDHRDRRIRRICDAVLATMHEDVQAGVDLIATTDHFERSLEARNALTTDSGRFFAVGSRALRSLKCLSRAQAMERLSTVNDAFNALKNDRVRQPDFDPKASKADSVRFADSEPSRKPAKQPDPLRSSSDSKDTTTTILGLPDSIDDLTWPERLPAAEQAKVGKALRLVADAEHQQMLLDELEGRLRWGKSLRADPASWFNGMVQNYLRGPERFVPNWADKVRRYRARQASRSRTDLDGSASREAEAAPLRGGAARSLADTPTVRRLVGDDAAHQSGPGRE